MILGAAEVGYVEMMAETVTAGDPTYTGPLAGVSLGLPVHHILEDEIQNQVDPAKFEAEVGLMALTLDKEKIREGMVRVRSVG